jgi:hypothetical protein
MNVAHSRQVSVRWTQLVALALLCFLVSGCSSGEYRRRMEESIQRLQAQAERAAAVFADIHSVRDASNADTGISLRFPVFVDESSKSLKASEGDAQPPFCKLPGLAYAYEVPLEQGPAYVYLAAVKADQKSAEELAEEVETAVGKAFSGAAWQQVTLAGVSSGEVTLRKLSVAGPQRFGSEKVEGQFDLYLASSASHHVLVGWRASVAADSAKKIFDKVAISMGTLRGAT